MNKLKQYRNYLEEHRTILKAAVIVLVMIAAVLFFTLKGEESESSEEFFQPGTEAAGEILKTPGNETAEGENNGSAEIFVDIGGQVVKPGVYAVKEGARIFEVIEKAGGLTEKAETEQLNQAEVVFDGQKIWIPSAEEILSGKDGREESPAIYGQSSGTAEGKININTADSSRLQEIPGVGPATAEKIIAYRKEIGRFAKTEDIKNVNGIGEKTYEKMKEKITV